MHPANHNMVGTRATIRAGLTAWVALALALGSVAIACAQETPDFALRSLDGANLRLSEYRGQVVMLGFWARWCGDCRQAMKALNEINGKYQRAGLVTLGINVDDPPDQAAAMSRSLGLSYPILLDAHQAASSAFELKSMPLIVLIDREGRQRYRHTSFELGDETRLSDELRKLLNE